MTSNAAAVGRWLLLPLMVPLSAAAQDGRHPGSLDAPYAATHPLTVDAMLRIAGVGPKDFVIDLGSGDGRILIAAAKKYGARGLGVELDKRRVKESIANAKDAGVTDRVEFQQRNLFDTKIGEATVVTMYLLPKVNLELRPRLLKELKPGTRVVSHAFDMGDWKPDLQATVRGTGNDIHYWVIPAQVHGMWKLELDTAQGIVEYELDITQKYQEINVVGRRARQLVLIRNSQVEGESIHFILVDRSDIVYRRRFEGRASSGIMEGTARGDVNTPSVESKWRATKLAGRPGATHESSLHTHPSSR